MFLAVVQQHWQRHLSEAKRKHEMHVIAGSVKCGVTSFTNEQRQKAAANEFNCAAKRANMYFVIQTGESLFNQQGKPSWNKI